MSGKMMGPVACDKCDGPNDRAVESNYCTRCSREYQARIQQDPEQRRVSAPDPRRST